MYATPTGLHIYFRGAREFEEPPAGSTAWSHAKRAMTFARVVNDGEGEGMLMMDRLPTPAEADVIRDKLSIRKRPSSSEQTIDNLRTRVPKNGPALGRSAGQDRRGDGGMAG